MNVTDKVVDIKTRLDAIISKKELTSPDILDLLKSLEKVPVDLDVLQKTCIGKTVNILRKETTNDNVSNICKILVKNWKGLLNKGPEDARKDGSPASNGSATTEPSAKRIKTEPGLSHSASSEDIKKTNSASLQRSASVSTAATPSPPAPRDVPASRSSKANGSSNGTLDTFTNDLTRLKTRELIQKALTKEAIPDGSLDPEKLAAEIESHVFKDTRSTDMKYKNRVRGRILNLQDSKNPQLRENVLLGHISAERFAVMTSDEMASAEMKKLREQFTKEAINDHQMATTGGTETDLLQCGKCKQRKCTYNQVQTRSADEPMTTFVYCNHCGNRWKFC